MKLYIYIVYVYNIIIFIYNMKIYAKLHDHLSLGKYFYNAITLDSSSTRSSSTLWKHVDRKRLAKLVYSTCTAAKFKNCKLRTMRQWILVKKSSKSKR